MKTFAVLEDNVVINLIVSDSLEDAETITGKTCVEYLIPQIGFSYVDEKFVRP
jgi:hypothetical protein